RRGRKVLLLEQFELGHARGSSHGDSRITRLTYHAGTYVRLAREAFAAWAELERDAEELLFFRTGDVFMGPADGAIAGYERVGEALELETGRGRYAAERLVLAGGPWMGRILQQGGRAGTEAGPTDEEGRPLPLRVLRQEVCYFAPRETERFRMDRFPVWVKL